MLLRCLLRRNTAVRYHPPGRNDTCNVIQKRTFFANWIANIDNSAAVHFTATNLARLHEYIHLPWWLEIALVTVTLRALVTFPLTINQKKIFQRHEALTPEIEAITAK